MMVLRDVSPFPVATSPGYEGFAADVLEHGGAEEVAWVPAGGEAVPLRGVFREKAQKIEGPAGTSWHPLTTVLLSASDVPGIADGDTVEARGRVFTVGHGGVHPDGIALVRVDLTEAFP